jgi:tyrosinase
MRGEPVATVRKNQAELTLAEKTAFVNAVLELKKRGVYDGFVRIHKEIMMWESADDNGPRVAHRSPSFLPWHRKFLIDIEHALQDVNPDVSLPYWNFSVDNQPTSSLWSDDFLGGDGDSRDDNKVKTGPFAYATGNWELTQRLDDRPYLRRFFHNGFGRHGEISLMLPSPNDVRKTMSQSEYDVAPWNTGSASGFRNMVEGWIGGMHNMVHTWVGGSMLPLTSPNDPVFFLTHCFIDKLWADWQEQHPDQEYLPTQATANEIGIDDAMRPWNGVTPRDMLDYKRFYTYA